MRAWGTLVHATHGHRRALARDSLGSPGGDMLFAAEAEPLRVGSPHLFFINPCTREHSDLACVDEENKSLPYMVCQTTEDGTYDLGSVVGFEEEAPGRGRLEVTGGERCWNGQRRQTTVFMACNPQV